MIEFVRGALVSADDLGEHAVAALLDRALIHLTGNGMAPSDWNDEWGLDRLDQAS